MGSFSWYKADKKDNIVYGDTVKMLIPQEFGGGYILGIYEDYGDINENGIIYDIYELIAIWNNKKIYNAVKELGYNNPARISSEDKELSHLIRHHGINIACYDEDHPKCKYQIKLVSANCDMTYEECENISLNDEKQGFWKHAWTKQSSYEDYIELKKKAKRKTSKEETRTELNEILEKLKEWRKN